MKKPYMYSKNEILEWAARYYDSRSGDEEVSGREAEIVDANIDVPKEEVEKAGKTLREKFDFVFGKFDELYADIKHPKEDITKSPLTKLQVFSAAAAVGLSVGLGLAGYFHGNGFIIGEAAVMGTMGSVLIGHTIYDVSGIGDKRKAKQAAEVGLNLGEFKWLREYDKQILKQTKQTRTFPSFETEAEYYIYLQMKMLNHQLLLEDKMNSDKEQNKGEE